MNTQDVLSMFNDYVIANYGRLPKVITKGQNNTLTDLDGNTILDMFPGWAVSGIGHCHPKVVEALRKQAGELLHIDNTFYTIEQGQLAKRLSERAFGGQCFFCNSGAEANEAALKLARRHTPREKYKFITAEKSFHGRTLATVAATGQPKCHDGFLPLPAGFVYVPFNDIDALHEAFDEEVCAVMIEPIQGEGGVHEAAPEYMQTIRDLCDEHDALMILDEVQTGMGRTGRWFGYQHYEVTPDIITLAKALGGGVAIGAMMARPEIAKSFVPGTHASTFGGNSLACAAAIAVIEAIDEDKLLDNANVVGRYTRDKLEQLREKYPIIDHIRGRGLMLGLQLNMPGAGIVSRCLEKGLRINCTQETVLRLMPSMTVTQNEIDAAVAILDEVLGEGASE
ncbi:MAG: aspartate aminotransferase family protein [Planctomycetota bacterium]|nr:MAG: aspartate aminotransferase family protein [Planctomycetota bacterium]